MSDTVIRVENLGKKYVIGRNGAGKSTLKVLSRITEPTEGGFLGCHLFLMPE